MRRIFARQNLLAALVILAVVPASFAANSNVLRMAVGPFFAPVANDALRQASQALPELLTAQLSHMPRFQLVEREKAQSVWNEYNLNASGLVVRDTVAKLGHVLACDWVVSGTIVEANGHTYVWTKVIDVRSGVVVDLNASPYDPGNSSKTITEIAAFLEKAGTQPKGRQFIAMGPIVDMSPLLGAKREDWSRRIQASIEKHFLDAGFGVVEIAAVGPIFEERRLEAAGLTGNPDGQVKLQAAFWLIDAGYEWNQAASDQLRIGLRVQKVGAAEQMFWLNESVNGGVEPAVIAAIQGALTNVNAATPSPSAEADLLLARAEEIATARPLGGSWRPSSLPPQQSPRKRTQWDTYKEMQEMMKRGRDNEKANIAIYERTLLRDPNNLEAKTLLGSLLIIALEPATREGGKALLLEVAATQNPSTERANFYLKNADQFLRQREENMASFRRPTDWLSVNQAFAENPDDPEAKCDLAAAMLRGIYTDHRERARKMLAEVAAGDRPDQAERARKLLAEPEKTPAIPRPVMAQSAPATPPPLDPENDEVRELREFLQKNFEKLTPAQFTKDDQGLAKFLRVPVKECRFEYRGEFYSGFRFTAPDWLDGDFNWMHILAKTEAQKNFSTKGTKGSFGWCILPKSGRMNGFRGYKTITLADAPDLRARFPYTNLGFTQGLPKDSLEPGREYAIWFAYADSDLPDIAFAMTIDSLRGRVEYGPLPGR